MKTTVEIDDFLFARARRLAKRTGRPMRSLIEEGLHRCLEAYRQAPAYELPDRSVGLAGGVNPLDSLSWQDLRNEIYGGR